MVTLGDTRPLSLPILSSLLLLVSFRREVVQRSV